MVSAAPPPSPLFRERRDPTGLDFLEVAVRGTSLAELSFLNKGTAFSDDEREMFGLRGLLPPAVQSIEEQIQRVLANFSQKTTDLERYIYLNALLDRNETLFYRVLLDHIDQMLPIIYTPTVGQACQQFGRIHRKSRGIYITAEDIDRIDAILGAWPHPDVEIIVVTDGERILGLGDLGAGGMGITIGKVSLYVAGAGIHPARALPVCLDVGTNNKALLEDPLYLGTRRPRLRGPEYDALIDAFFAAVSRRFPRAIIQFEDFAKINAFRLLERERTQYRTFNDDIQGTGAVTAAGIFAALRIKNEKIEQQKVFITGGGSAGVGIARMLKGAEIWMFDSKGLVTHEREKVSEEQLPYVRHEAPGSILEVAKRVHPTALIGVSGQPGLFSKELIEAMSSERPIVFPLSNPTSQAECIPAEVLKWTGGRALVAAGSPFPDTPQCNNLYIFPGVGLGAVSCGARRITDDFFRAAAMRLAELAPNGQLYPPLSEIRMISREVALAVAKSAIATGQADPCDEGTLRARIAAEIWEPRYLPYRPAR